MEPETTTLQGGCACGQLRYQLASPPLFVHCCHCQSCQRETGAGFAINALIEADRIEILQGEAVDIDTPTASGQGQRITRCARCQVAVWSRYAYGPIAEFVRFVRVGTLDAPPRLPPDIHIFTESKLPWLALPEGASVMAKFYKASEHWPAESLERRAALFARLERS
ncbi:MAG: GFA family protein [Myxococcales bacterium]|nr:GFA family protein [Myxococcales bacterium]